jgi:hypothetical protein
VVGAWIIEIDHHGQPVARGYHEFVQLPAIGDRVTLTKDETRLDVMGVIYVEHAPVRVTEHGREARRPTATVYVHWLAEDDLRDPKRTYL